MFHCAANTTAISEASKTTFIEDNKRVGIDLLNSIKVPIQRMKVIL